MSRGLFTLGKLFVKIGYSFHARGLGVGGCPLPEKNGAFFLDLGVGERVGGCYSEAFKQRFIGEGSLKTRPSIFDKAIEDSQSSELLVNITVFTD